MIYSGEELLEMWRESGISQRRLAEQLGVNFDIMHGRLYRAQEAEKRMADTGERIEIDTKDNVREITVKGLRIKTLEQLIRVCEINLDDWTIQRHVCNAWEVTTREGNTYTNHQVKAWLFNKRPEPVVPVISKVEIGIKKHEYPANPLGETGTAMILADPHFGFIKDVNTGELVPFHDRRALSIALQLVTELQPDILILQGDWIDFAEWSDKFIRSPDMYNTTQPALVEGAWFIGQLCLASPKTKIYFLRGI